MKYGALNHEQARFYRDQGYYRLINVFEHEETAEMRQFIQDEVTKTDSGTDESNSNKKLYGLYDRNPELVHRL